MKYAKFASNRSLEEATEIFNQRIKDAIEVYDKFHTQFIHRDCPVCGSKNHSDAEAFIDRYKVSVCNTCQTEFVNPAPDSEALAYYYNSCECNLMLERIYNKRHKKSFINDSRIEFLKTYIHQLLDNRDSINICEVGCNNGTFLATIKDYMTSEELDKRCNLFGIDLDANAVNNKVDQALQLHAIPAEQIDTLNTNFDLIISFELIEHLADPETFMKSLHNVMNPGAIMVLTTPNALGLETKAIGYNKTRLLAHSIYPPMHLNAFNTQNILLFAHRCGFKLSYLDTPGQLDVDMISIVADELDDEHLKRITEFNEETRAYFQYLTAYLNGSSHMRIVLSA